MPDDELLRAKSAVGCRFYPRCTKRMDHCLTKQPPLYQINGPAHQAACYLYDELPVANA